MHSEWRCDSCGDVSPFHVAEHIGPEILEEVDRPVPEIMPEPEMSGELRAPHLGLGD